jgi:hypothetical protein
MNDEWRMACKRARGGTGFQPVKSGILPDFARTKTAQTMISAARKERPDAPNHQGRAGVRAVVQLT